MAIGEHTLDLGSNPTEPVGLRSVNGQIGASAAVSLYHPPATGFNIDEVNVRFIEPVAPVTAIGADIETGRATP